MLTYFCCSHPGYSSFEEQWIVGLCAAQEREDAERERDEDLDREEELAREHTLDGDVGDRPGWPAYADACALEVDPEELDAAPWARVDPAPERERAWLLDWDSGWFGDREGDDAE